MSGITAGWPAPRSSLDKALPAVGCRAEPCLRPSLWRLRTVCGLCPPLAHLNLSGFWRGLGFPDCSCVGPYGISGGPGPRASNAQGREGEPAELDPGQALDKPLEFKASPGAAGCVRLLIQQLPARGGSLGSPGEGSKCPVIDQFSLSVCTGPRQRSGSDSPGGWSPVLTGSGWPPVCTPVD